MTNIIVAYDSERGIGANERLLWQHGEMKDDMKRFRALTSGNPVIMGRVTLESIGVALPNRQNIVVSRQEQLPFDGVELVGTLEEAYVIARSEERFIIGGSQIYQQALDSGSVDRIYATEVMHAFPEADTFFPSVDSNEWTVTASEEHDSDDRNRYPYRFVTLDKKPTDFVNLANARTEAQLEVMNEIIENKECPFCENALHKYHKEPILRQGDHWLVTPNQWPYDNTSLHLLAITKYHSENLKDLRDGAMDELQKLLTWIESEYGLDAGTIAMRFGDTKRTGATVQHLHLHIIVADPNKPKDVKVRFKVG